MPVVTLKDIALEIGVSEQTISRALRNDPHVRPELAERIRKVADRLGYRPDPRIRALLSQMRRRKSSRQGETIALLLPDTTRQQASNSYYMGEVMRGARERADQSGFGLEIHSLVEQPSRAHLERMLYVRGIGLLILAPVFAKARGHVFLHWDRYATVLIGPGIWRPQLNRVVQNFYLNTLLLLRQLRKLGYRRPGLIVPGTTLERAAFAVEASFCEFAPLLGLQNPKKFIWTDNPVTKPEACRNWIREKDLDVIVSDHSNPQIFVQMGLRIPEEIGFVSLLCHPYNKTTSGINVHIDLLGAHAVDLVAGHYYRNERGIPQHPKIQTHEATWKPGTTLRGISGK